MGPIDIRKRGEERLVAELGATPGRRLEHVTPKMQDKQLYATACFLPRIRGPYRHRLLRNRLTFTFQERRLPLPKRVNIRIRQSCAWLLGTIALVVRLVLAGVATQEPDKARYMKANTKIVMKGDPKVSFLRLGAQGLEAVPLQRDLADVQGREG